MARKTKKTAGRPKGSRNNLAATVTVAPSRCPKCNSTERSEDTNKTVQQYQGTAPDGQPFTAIIRRRTQCRECGQWRVDRTFEYALKKKSESD